MTVRMSRHNPGVISPVSFQTLLSAEINTALLEHTRNQGARRMSVKAGSTAYTTELSGPTTSAPKAFRLVPSLLSHLQIISQLPSRVTFGIGLCDMIPERSRRDWTKKTSTFVITYRAETEPRMP